MRKIYSFLLTLLLLTACGGETSVDMQADSSDTAAWRIAVLPTMDCLPLFVASERGFFSDEGLSVGLRRYEAQMDADTALCQGVVVGVATDLVRAARLRQLGMGLTSVTATDAAWQLVTQRTARISQLRQLDDKMLAMTRYSATDLLADLAVDSAKLKPDRVFRIQVNDVGVRFGMLQSNIMDAMFLPEPFATKARQLKARVLMDTRQMDIRLGTIVFADDSLKGKEPELKAFLRAYDRAVDSLNERGLAAYRELLEQRLGMAPQTVDSLAADSTLHFSRSATPRQADVERVDSWWKKRLESMKYVEKRYL